MANCRVVVTGMGIICPLGSGIPNVWQALLDGQTGVVSVAGDSKFQNLPCTVVAPVPEVYTPNDLKFRHFSRASRLALIAADEALKDSQLPLENQKQRESTGVAVGSGMADLDDIHNTGNLLDQGRYNRISPFFVPRILTNMPGGNISIKYGLLGPNHSVSTACAAGAHSVGDAFNLIRRGHASAMVCGATEACISPITVAGMARLRALSTKYNDAPTEASRPFDAKRDGFVLGEGAGILVLEELTYARRRRAKRIYAEVLGYGLSGDGYHLTSPDPTGRGAYLCMKRALTDANVSHLDYVNAHATSTPIGDDIEAKSIDNVLYSIGTELAIPVSSTKGATGHLLGSAGAVEIIFTILSLFHEIAPPTVNFVETDIKAENRLLDFVPNQPKQLRSSSDARLVALSNSFGFGGTNASVCIGSFSDI